MWGGGEIFEGLLGIEPYLCAWSQHPLQTAPKVVATLSLKVLKDSESAACPYLLHAKAVVCLVLPPQLLCVGVCFVWYFAFPLK